MIFQDNNGHELQVGDKVLMECVVTGISSQEILADDGFVMNHSLICRTNKVVKGTLRDYQPRPWDQ